MSIIQIMIILYQWLRLHRFPSLALFLSELSQHLLPPTFTLLTLYIFLSHGVSSPPLSTSPASESLCLSHYCGHRLCETFASFSYFCLPFWNLCSIFTWRFYQTYLPPLAHSTRFLVAFLPSFSILSPYFLKSKLPYFIYSTSF